MSEMTPFSPLELMDLQANALFTHDANGRMVTKAQPWDGTAAAPKFYLGRTTNGKVMTRFRHDVSASIIDKLEALLKNETPALAFDEMPVCKNQYLEILGETNCWGGPCWLVPAHAAQEKQDASEPAPVFITRHNINTFSVKGFEWLLDEIDVAEPCAGVIIEGRLVSLCRSVRRTPAAHEAGLETTPEFRGKGYAGMCVKSWAAAVKNLGALPFYSTSWNNGNSQKVAEKLGFYYVGNNFSIG